MVGVLFVQHAKAQPGPQPGPQSSPAHRLRFVNDYNVPILLKLVGFQNRALYVTTLGPGESVVQPIIPGERVACVWDLEGHLLRFDVLSIDRPGVVHLGPPVAAAVPGVPSGTGAAQGAVPGGPPAAGAAGVPAAGAVAGQAATPPAGAAAAGQTTPAAGPVETTPATGAAAGAASGAGGLTPQEADAASAALERAAEEAAVPGIEVQPETAPELTGETPTQGAAQPQEATQPQVEAPAAQSGGLTIEPEETDQTTPGATP